MLRKIFFLSISAGIFSSVACIVYNKVYYFALESNFSKLVNVGSIVGLNMIACIAAGGGYYVAKKRFPKKGNAIFNLTFSLISFLSIYFPFAIDIPLDIKNPELFYGLVVPMHFFPVVSWFALKNLYL